MQNFPYIYTFYSYKGGVGRSMSLLNTAYALAGRGRHVLVLDMDLEAPGVSDFLINAGELDGAPQKDILDLLEAVTAFEHQGYHPDKAVEQIEDLSVFIASVRYEKYDSLKPKLGEPGRLDVIPAAVNSDNYWERLTDLGLESCSQDKLSKYSLILKYYLKAQRLSISPPGLDELHKNIDVPYDYILVDSRTGITELGGLCVGPLADRLVILTALNEQNINGTLSMMNLAGIEPKTQDHAHDPWDEAVPSIDDDKTPPMLGPKPTLLVASPVPTGEIDYKRKRIHSLEKQIGKVAARLSYHSQMALVESVFVRDYPEEYLSMEYNILVNRLMALSSDSAYQLAQLSHRAYNEKDIENAIKYALRLCSDNYELGVSLFIQLHNELRPSKQEEFEAAYQMYALLAKTDQDFINTIYMNWGNALADQARVKSGEEADRLYELSYEKYEQALFIKPDYPEALNNWGNALAEQAKVKTGAESDRLYELSYEKYEQALYINPDDKNVLFNQACWWALHKNVPKTIEKLNQIKEAPRDLASKVKNDPDFSEILDHSDFKAFLNSLES